MDEDLETRRRRAAWRASHRGTKELDLLIGGYASEKLPEMGADELSRFEAFLAVNDPDLQEWLLAPECKPEPAHADLVAMMRSFHGLG